VDDAPQTDDLDLVAVAGREALIAMLQTVYLRADRPSLRVLEARTRHGAVPLSKTVASELLRGERFPRKAVMLAFLLACGVQDDRLEPWRRAWERIAVLEAKAARAAQPPGEDRGTGPAGGSLPAMAAGPDPAGDEVRLLREENQELRRRLAAPGSGAIGMQSYRDDEPRGGEAGNPVVSRRELGASLRALRLKRGMTVEQVAGHLMCSAGKVSRMESGFRSGTLRDVRDLCSLYDVPEGAERDRLMELARESKRQGWWQVQAQGLDYFGSYVGLEDGAASMREYESAVVPGLLQTERYARAMYGSPDGSYSPERREELVQVRLTRQRILTRPDPPDYRAILDEAVLRRSVGGPGVMRDQYGHLIEASRLPNVTLQVVPFAAGAHNAAGSNFVILEFSGQAPEVVYTEGLFGWLYLERAVDVKRYHEVFASVRRQALDEEESRMFLTTMMSETGDSISPGTELSRCPRIPQIHARPIVWVGL
jgi:transcriptional regulator with XRE-family HTH domain